MDIFSLGCVYYYVLSNGGHPFGDTVKRQLNILSYEYDLKIFSGEKYENSKVSIFIARKKIIFLEKCCEKTHKFLVSL